MVTITAEMRGVGRQYFEGLALSIPLMKRYQAVADHLRSLFIECKDLTAMRVAGWASHEKWPRWSDQVSGPTQPPKPAPPRDPIDYRDMLPIREALAREIPTDTDFVARLEDTARKTLQLAEALIQAIPGWMGSMRPSQWSVDQGLKAMRMLPNYLQATVELDKVAAELRLARMRVVQATGDEQAHSMPPPIVEAIEALREQRRKASLFNTDDDGDPT